MNRPSVDLARMKTPWSMKTKVKRGLWNLVQALLFRPSPKGLGKSWRVFLLRSFGAQIGPGCLILPSVKVLCPWNMNLGRGVVIGADVDFYSFAEIRIGDNAMVSQRTFLCTGTHDFTDPTYPLTYQPIEIGANAWVASECFVGPGVKIGAGSVVAARSVVVKDLPEWMVCAGQPCRPLKPRELRTEEECLSSRPTYE